MKNQIILRENRHCDPDLTITANGHDSAATNNHNLHENDLPTNEDSNPDFSRKSDYFEVMSDLVEDEEVDSEVVDHCEYVTIPTNKTFSFASSNGTGNGSLVGGASGDSTEFYYEEELELKLEKPKIKSHEEVVVIEEVTLPIKIQESESSESESESESETDSDSTSSCSDVEPSVHIVEVTKSQCDGNYF